MSSKKKWLIFKVLLIEYQFGERVWNFSGIFLLYNFVNLL